MAERRKFPPLDDPARFEAIVGRGRTLRRRRQLGVGAGAGGGVAAVALAVVMVTGSGGGADRIQHDIVADDDKVEAVETTTTTTTTEAPRALPSEFVAEIETAGDELTITLIDPAQPESEDSKQCALVTIDGPDGVREIYGCDDVPAVDGAITLDVPPASDVQIGCAAIVYNTAVPVSDETRLKSTTFSLKVPSTVPRGEYSVTVAATSGVGDTCAGTGDEATPGEPPAAGAAEYEAYEETTITVG